MNACHMFEEYVCADRCFFKQKLCEAKSYQIAKYRAPRRCARSSAWKWETHNNVQSPCPPKYPPARSYLPAGTCAPSYFPSGTCDPLHFPAGTLPHEARTAKQNTEVDVARKQVEANTGATGATGATARLCDKHDAAVSILKCEGRPNLSKPHDRVLEGNVRHSNSAKWVPDPQHAVNNNDEENDRIIPAPTRIHTRAEADVARKKAQANTGKTGNRTSATARLIGSGQLIIIDETLEERRSFANDKFDLLEETSEKVQPVNSTTYSPSPSCPPAGGVASGLASSPLVQTGPYELSVYSVYNTLRHASPWFATRDSRVRATEPGLVSYFAQIVHNLCGEGNILFLLRMIIVRKHRCLTVYIITSVHSHFLHRDG